MNKTDLFQEKILQSGRHLRNYLSCYKGSIDFLQQSKFLIFNVCKIISAWWAFLQIWSWIFGIQIQVFTPHIWKVEHFAQPWSEVFPSCWCHCDLEIIWLHCVFGSLFKCLWHSSCVMSVCCKAGFMCVFNQWVIPTNRQVQIAMWTLLLTTSPPCSHHVAELQISQCTTTTPRPQTVSTHRWSSTWS